MIIGLLLPFALVLFQQTREQAGAAMLAAGATMLGAFFAVADISIGSQLIPMTHLEWETLAPEPYKTAFGIFVMVVLFGLFLVSYKLLPYETPVSQKSEA